MKETAERMDSALFFSLVGEEERARKMYAENLPEFEKGLDLEMHNITLPHEKEYADQVRELHDLYLKRAAVFWQTSDISARRKMYFDEMLPTFTEVKDRAQDIIRINEDNMVLANGQAKTLSAQSTRYMVLAVLVGVVGAFYFAWHAFNGRFFRQFIP